MPRIHSGSTYLPLSSKSGGGDKCENAESRAERIPVAVENVPRSPARR
jgi:hypothetical protein